MQNYRLYFRDRSGRICGREDFEAPDKQTAWCMAEIVFGACSDRAANFDLWCGSDAVRELSPPAPMLVEVTEQRQSNIAELEERIRDSAWHVATSQELLRRLEGLRRLGPDEPPASGIAT